MRGLPLKAPSIDHGTGFTKDGALSRKGSMRDSSRESSMVAALHEQTHPAELQDPC